MPIASKPEVAVIIPTYNRAGLIGRAIKSVLAQTYNNYELVVVDDCSADNTGEVVDSFKDDRIKYIRYETNKGVSAARNTGIKATDTKYIAFLDDDDEYLPAFLEKQVEAISNTPERVGIVYTDLMDTYCNTTTKKEGNIHKDALRLQFNCSAECFLIKRTCLEKIGLFDESLAFAEDVDMVIRLSSLFHFKHVNEALVLRHITEGALCSNIDTFITGFSILLNKHFVELSKDRKALSRFYLHIGHFLVLKGEVEKGRRYIIDAVKADPFSIKAIVAGLILSADKHKYIPFYLKYVNYRYRKFGM